MTSKNTCTKAGFEPGSSVSETDEMKTLCLWNENKLKMKRSLAPILRLRSYSTLQNTYSASSPRFEPVTFRSDFHCSRLFRCDGPFISPRILRNDMYVMMMTWVQLRKSWHHKLAVMFEKNFYPGGIRTLAFCSWGECDVHQGFHVTSFTHNIIIIQAGSLIGGHLKCE
jgi:hypothetical protein